MKVSFRDRHGCVSSVLRDCSPWGEASCHVMGTLKQPVAGPRWGEQRRAPNASRHYLPEVPELLPELPWELTLYLQPSLKNCF